MDSYRCDVVALDNIPQMQFKLEGLSLKRVRFPGLEDFSMLKTLSLYKVYFDIDFFPLKFSSTALTEVEILLPIFYSPQQDSTPLTQNKSLRAMSDWDTYREVDSRIEDITKPFKSRVFPAKILPVADEVDLLYFTELMESPNLKKFTLQTEYQTSLENVKLLAS